MGRSFPDGPPEREDLERMNAEAAERGAHLTSCPSPHFDELERDQMVADEERCTRTQARALPAHEYNFLLRAGMAKREEACALAEQQVEAAKSRQTEANWRADAMANG